MNECCIVFFADPVGIDREYKAMNNGVNKNGIHFTASDLTVARIYD